MRPSASSARPTRSCRWQPREIQGSGRFQGFRVYRVYRASGFIGVQGFCKGFRVPGLRGLSGFRLQE